MLQMTRTNLLTLIPINVIIIVRPLILDHIILTVTPFSMNIITNYFNQSSIGRSLVDSVGCTTSKPLAPLHT